MNKNFKKDNKGFSLVELIIVIAIMAILIGVVALQVIPYLEKSRVGKDKQTVDTVYSAFQSAIAANEEAAKKSSLTITITGTAEPTDSDATVQAVIDDMTASLGGSCKDLEAKLASKDAVGKNIVCTYTAPTASAAAKIEVEVSGTSIKSSNK